MPWPDMAKRKTSNVRWVIAEIRRLDSENAELLAACRYEANDRMDGDILSIVASYLLVQADDYENLRGKKNGYAVALRDWANKLIKKQKLQTAAITNHKEG